MSPRSDGGRDARAAYEVWHAALEIQPEPNAPWQRLVKAHLEPGRDLAVGRLLEIGCGRGDFACWLARQGVRPATIVAADFAGTAVAKGRAYAARAGIPGIDWQVADATALPHPDGAFDTVISCETIEHVPDPGRAVAELARVLRPGGRLFLTTPNYLGTMGLYRIYFRLRGRVYTETGQPINHLMTIPRTAALVRRAGLRLRAIDAIGHYLPFPGRPPIELPWLDRPRALSRWLALHSLTVAEKP